MPSTPPAPIPPPPSKREAGELKLPSSLKLKGGAVSILHDGKGGVFSMPHHGSHRRHHWGRRWYIPTSRARLACGDGDAVPIQSKYSREPHHVVGCSLAAPCSRTLPMPHHVVRYMSPLAAFLLTFRVEGNFSSPASPERRGGGTGAGWYVRHPAAKGINR